jgi:hypothetical protein
MTHQDGSKFLEEYGKKVEKDVVFSGRYIMCNNRTIDSFISWKI